MREDNVAFLMWGMLLALALCALGGLTPHPVRSALRHFPEDFDRAAAVTSAATRG